MANSVQAISVPHNLMNFFMSVNDNVYLDDQRSHADLDQKKNAISFHTLEIESQDCITDERLPVQNVHNTKNQQKFHVWFCELFLLLKAEQLVLVPQFNMCYQETHPLVT
ncbi:hypothetical protein T4D_985 [Trichinella pseudospiralis]|uniref:Uncharacterized protein n=1 Tax=Trichinella pseudospiralis TaxID=6337 RepID=A0A0V1G1L5_TRIPS|nr:hypothetical protein T4D_985 [Trichinella pseudospiralis]